MNINYGLRKLRKYGITLWLGGWQEIWPTVRSYIPCLRRLKNFRLYSDCLQGKNGLEIGGPSNIFQQKMILPLYPIIGSLDGCNFAARTIWEGELTAGQTYQFDRQRPKGYQYLNDAVDLRDIAGEKYDFVLSSHCLEHIANPLKALREWLRVLKPRGFLLLVVPAKKWSFDRKRPTTEMHHLLSDYENNVGEDDLTHLPEIIALSDVVFDIGSPGRPNMPVNPADNLQNRNLHHHVYDDKLLENVYQYLDLKILAVDYAEPGHIIILGQKR